MPDYLTQVTIHTTDGVAANYATNVFMFQADDLAALAGAHGELSSRYDGIAGFLSSNVALGGHMITSYDIADPTPRAPVLETEFSFPVAPNDNPLPHQVSIVLSFQGDRVSGVNQARRRGRVYIPFTGAQWVDPSGRPDVSITGAIVGFGNLLLEQSRLSASWTWMVYSRADGAVVPITNGWVDNRYDIQRRRGREPTARTTYDGLP